MSIQRFKNVAKEVEPAYGSVPASFGTLVNLGTTLLFNHLKVVNKTDQTIVVRMTGEDGALNDMTFEAAGEAGSAVALDGLFHNGIIQYKYASDPPSSGSFKWTSW